MLSSILESNDAHLAWPLQKVLASGKKRIGFIGLSFKSGTDDLRESPLVTLAEQLIGKGLQLSIYDPDVHLSQLLGANRRYIEQHLPHIGQLVRADIDAVIKDSELLVVALGDKTVTEALQRSLRADQQVLDLTRLANASELPAAVQGLNW
jgi:GDP-mannose 6-dehydrogenase